MNNRLQRNRMLGMHVHSGPLSLILIAFLCLSNCVNQAAENPAKSDQNPVDLDSDPSLIGWWKFDQVEGENTQDASAGKHTAKLVGGSALTNQSVDGRYGKALQFDGKDLHLSITGFKGVTGTSARTIVAWVKTTKPGGEILSWGSDEPGKKWTLGFIRGRVGVTPRGGYLYMKQDVHNNQWHQVAVVVSEASPPNLHDHVKLFKDGELAEIDDIGLLDMYPIETGDKLDVRIGWRFNGALDDVRIYQRALTENEIKNLFKK